jgi:hypothetical protein
MMVSADQPLAWQAAMIAPMLEPPMKSIGIWASSSARSTPMWANARAPPPDSTSPTEVPAITRARCCQSRLALSRRWKWRLGCKASSHCRWCARGAGRGAVQQHQVGELVGGALGQKGAGEARVEAAVGRHQRNDPVGLAGAHVGPLAVLQIAAQEHVVMGRFQPGKVGCGSVVVAGRHHMHARSGRSSSLGQSPGEASASTPLEAGMTALVLGSLRWPPPIEVWRNRRTSSRLRPEASPG